jgi:hypothetical protein
MPQSGLEPANAFINRPDPPGEADLTAELGDSRALWDQLLDQLAKEHGVTTVKWHSYSRKTGWSLRLKRGERTILYLLPSRGSFRAAFVLGDQAVAAARGARLPKAVLRAIEQAKRYAEGTGIRLDIRSAKDLAVVAKLTRIKIEK